MDRRLCLQLAERLDTVHDALIGVFINLHGDELRLADSDDRRHHQHRLVESQLEEDIQRWEGKITNLGAQSVRRDLILSFIIETKNKLRQRSCEDRPCEEISTKDQSCPMRIRI